MIIFYNKKTGDIHGSIEGRVHFDNHLKVGMSFSEVDKNDIEKAIIGYEDTGETETIKDENGEEKSKAILKEHNLHLWKHLLEFEDPRNPKNISTYKAIFDKEGKIIDFKPK